MFAGCSRSLTGSCATCKLEVAPIAGATTEVHTISAAGPTVLKGFQLIGAADDFTYSERLSANVTVAGSTMAPTIPRLLSEYRRAPTVNILMQGFDCATNTLAFSRYRISFGLPVSGDRLQGGRDALVWRSSAGSADARNSMQRCKCPAQLGGSPGFAL